MQTVHSDPTGIPHAIVCGKRVTSHPRNGRVSVSPSMRSASYGPNVRTFFPSVLSPGATPVVSGLGVDVSEVSSWGNFEDVGGPVIIAPVATIAGTIVGALLGAATASRGWIGVILGGGFGYLATSFGRENKKLRKASGQAGTPPAGTK